MIPLGPVSWSWRLPSNLLGKPHHAFPVERIIKAMGMHGRCHTYVELECLEKTYGLIDRSPTGKSLMNICLGQKIHTREAFSAKLDGMEDVLPQYSSGVDEKLATKSNSLVLNKNTIFASNLHVVAAGVRVSAEACAQ